MTITRLKNSTFYLLLGTMFCTSCNGQTKSGQTNTAIFEQQPFTSKNAKLTKTQGADQNQNVHCGLQDKNGNLWFGTTGEGVYRYDGKLFTQFTEKDGLSSNKVWSILEDKSGNIWFGTEDGVSRYDEKTISKISIPPSSPSGFGIATSQPKINAVWSIGTRNIGLYRYDGKTFTNFSE